MKARARPRREAGRGSSFKGRRPPHVTTKATALLLGYRARQAKGARPGLLVALGEGIGLDQVGLVDHLELAVLLRLADAGLAPEVMVLVHLDVTLGRILELDTGRRRDHLVDIEAARLLDCC